MYLFFVIIPILLLVIFVNHRRKKKIIKKICCLSMDEKCSLLDELLEPFGYYYIASQDIFSSRIDAWQREMGYTAFYDKAAVRFRMIFDRLPVYFNYQGRTWLLEFWKGQYGITTGGEIGLYYADRILNRDELESSLFQAAEDKDMLKMSYTLVRNDMSIAQMTGKHWWLTCFNPGYFSRPEDLTLDASIHFPSPDMAAAFVHGLMKTGYMPKGNCPRCNTVSVSFDQSEHATGFFHRLRIRIAQWKNRFWCKVYLLITKPFCLSINRVLYLYFYLPFAFRKILRIRKYKKCKSGGTDAV